MDKKELQSYREVHYLTWGQLKAFAEKNKIPDDAIVVTERVEDKYYDFFGWSVYCKENDCSKKAARHNYLVETGKWKGKGQIFTAAELLSFKTQYHPVWSPVYYKEDPEILFLDLHY